MTNHAACLISDRVFYESSEAPIIIESNRGKLLFTTVCIKMYYVLAKPAHGIILWSFRVVGNSVGKVFVVLRKVFVVIN